MNEKIKYIFNNYFEIAAFSSGLVLLAFMDPTLDYRNSWCLFEMLGISFCPGEGLGHSIAYTFRAEITKALAANMLGPLSVIVLISRIGYLLKRNVRVNHKLN